MIRASKEFTYDCKGLRVQISLDYHSLGPLAPAELLIEVLGQMFLEKCTDKQHLHLEGLNMAAINEIYLRKEGDNR